MSSDEEWTEEIKEVHWTVCVNEDPVEKLTELYPFKSAFCKNRIKDVKENERNETTMDVDLLVKEYNELYKHKMCEGVEFNCTVIDCPDEDGIAVIKLEPYDEKMLKYKKLLDDWLSIAAVGHLPIKHTFRNQWLTVYYMDSWYRAVVINVCSQSLINVCLVDLGTTVTQSMSAMRPLQEAFTKYPEQAVKCNLLGMFNHSMYPGMQFDGIPMPCNFINDRVEEPLPLRILPTRNHDNISPYGIPDQYDSFEIKTSPVSSRRPPLPEVKYSEYDFNKKLTDIKESDYEYPMDLENNICLNEIKYQNINEINDGICTTDTASSNSDVGSVYNETNGVTNHLHSLLSSGKCSKYEKGSSSDSETVKTSKSIVKRKTSAVSAICYRIKSSFHLRKK